MRNNEIMKMMIPVFETYEYDWFGYLITDKNFLTAHHIKKRRGTNERGATTFDNIALLTNDAHKIVNELENFYPELYERCNEILKKINDSKMPPSKELLMEIMDLRKTIDYVLANKPEVARKSSEDLDEIKDTFNTMLKIFGTKHEDWMGYPISSNNPLNYYHIVSLKNGGVTSINNGALLTKKSQKLLVRAKLYDPELYSEYCYWFQIINDTKKSPSKEIMHTMSCLKKRLNGVPTKKCKRP